MPVRRVKVSYGRTLQPAPYESIRLEVTVEKDVLDNERLSQIADTITDSLVKYVRRKIASILENE